MQPADAAAALLPRANAAVAAVRRAAARIEAVPPPAILAPLVLAQLAVAGALAAGAAHVGWLYSTPDGGMNDWTASWALGHLWVPTAVASYGIPVLTWPLALVSHGSLAWGTPPVVIAQAAIGAPLVLLATYGIASRIAGRLFGYIAALGWVVAPLVALGWFYAGHGEFEGLVYEGFRGQVRDAVTPNVLGLTGLVGLPSILAVAVAAWLLVRCLDLGDWNDVLLSGLVSGFAVAIDPGNVVFLPAPVLALAVARRPRQALGFVAALVPAFATLALWRWTGSGHVSSLGTFSFDRETFRLNLINFKAVGWSVLLGEWIAVAGAFALIRKAPAKGVLVTAWFLGFFAGALGRGRVRDLSVLRQMEPGYPAFVLLAAAVLLLVPTWGRYRRRPSPAERRPRPTAALVAGVVVLALYPLALVAAASPAPRDHVVFGQKQERSVPVAGSFALRAQRPAGHAVLSWKRAPSAGTALSYRIYRSTGDGCVHRLHGGARDCLLSMGAAATVPAPGWTDPVAGRFTYRVAAVTGPGGDLLLISPAVRAP